MKGYDNLSVFTGVGLGCLAAVCALIFILVGAIMKAGAHEKERGTSPAVVLFLQIVFLFFCSWIGT